MSKIISTLFLSLIFLPLTGTSIAQESNCAQVSYGGGLFCATTEDITIDKRVLDPSSNSYLNEDSMNLSSGQIIDYQIIVKNTSDKDLKNLRVIDKSSQSVDFVKSSVEHEIKNNNIELKIDEVKPGESKTISLQVKLSEDIDQNTCLYNSAEIDHSREISIDTVRVCSGSAETTTSSVQNQTQPNTNNTNSDTQNTQTKGGKTIYPISNSTSTPDTGAGLISLITIISSGLTGLYIRKIVS